MDTRTSRPDEVQEASEESFPASDPPSYTPTTASQTDAMPGSHECYEAPFERAVCRIDIADRTMRADVPVFTARMTVIDPVSGARPVVLPSGERAEVHGRTASQALSSAMAFLGRHFGPPTLYERGCGDNAGTEPEGPPVVIEDV